MEGGIHIREACPGDVGAVLDLVQGLADFERLGDKVECTEYDLREALFGAAPSLGAALAWRDEAAVGLVTYYPVFSTFSGRRLLYVEDLYVVPSGRGEGVGRSLMAWLAGQACAGGYAGMRWVVLDWNASALAFYEGIGASRDTGWVPCSLSREVLTGLAASR